MEKTEKKLFALFLILGIIFLIAGVVIFCMGENFKKNGVEATAVITNINFINGTGKNNRYDKSNRYEVYVEYVVNGESYNQKLGHYTNKMRIGENINIYYNPNNPSEIQSNSLLLPIMFTGFGVIFTSIGSVIFILKANRNKLKNKLMENGRKIYADINKIVINGAYRVNGRSPYKISCAWKDERSETIYLFESENIWFDPKIIIEMNSIKQLPVYIDENNFKRYYVEIDKVVNNVEDMS